MILQFTTHKTPKNNRKKENKQNPNFLSETWEWEGLGSGSGSGTQQAQAQHNRAIVEARNRSTPHYHQSTAPKFGIISNLSSSFFLLWEYEYLISLSLMSESLVQKIAKFLLVDT